MRGFEPEDLRRAVVRLCADWTLPVDTQFHLLDGGYSHSNFRFTKDDEQYVVRMPGASTIDTEHEQRILRDLPEPTMAPVIAYLPETGHMLTRWVDGPLLVDAVADARVDVARIATWYAALRGQFPPMKKTYRLEDRVREYLDGSPTHTPMLKTATALMNETKLGAQLAPSHNDLNPWNVIVAAPTPEQWVTLDWESAGLNNPLFDLVTLHGGLGLDMPLTQFAALCRVDVQLTELRSVEVWFWLREYAWAVDQLRQGNERGEITDQMEASALKLEALATQV